MSNAQTAVRTSRTPIVALWPRPSRPHKVSRVPDTRRRLILDEELFRHAVVRERKRADRFEESFALVLVSLECEAGRARWNLVVEALANQRFETDLIGWYEQDTVIGLIRPLADQDPAEAANALAATVRRQLARCLERNPVGGCSIHLEVYSPHRDVVPAILVQSERFSQRSRRQLRSAAKRVLDLGGSLGLIAALAPVFLLIALAVKLTSKGPVFFRQERIGEGGRPFKMLKFRTMKVNADESIHKQYVTQFIHDGVAAEGGVFKIVNDPRITSIGHFLRRASLDELPQFWNVFQGDMSLVGPRPPLSYEVENYKRWHRRRLLEAKPGITGLWQVTGRSRTTFEDMVRLDLRYAKSHTVWTDVKILLATPRAVITGKGAH